MPARRFFPHAWRDSNGTHSRAFGLLAAHLYVNKRYAHISCSSCSPNTLVSDAEKRVVNCAVANSANVVPDSPPTLPCSFATVHICKELGRLKKKLR